MKNNVVPILAVSALALILSGCATTDSATPTTAPASSASAASWSYTGDDGPDHWGAVADTCSTSAAQSPIDIEKDALVATPTGAPEVHYQATAFEVENNGHTIEAVPEDLTHNYVVLEGTKYFLQQFHLHTTSEHTINGESSDLELHLVNKSEDGQIAVLGVLFNTGAANSTLTELFDSMPTEVTEEENLVKLSEEINPADLLPAGSEVVQYEGSLTTPPCTEGVRWNVFETVGEISADQLAAFQEIFPSNHRPTQDVNDREETETPAL
ncbi:carbonic anhydrase [Klugiella xanthotipulae]|uniref:Carbonic anhydrase n=1 Tax=Klugiella xanthotipulae TaxID=244735 RepID=A0A543I4H5_9MICO|nr:carbonic anhydrase family protein [Klugiella xanthotipulae]TQM65464.1 carbonic anhydrase [Klugiella xanthotipulae]